MTAESGDHGGALAADGILSPPTREAPTSAHEPAQQLRDAPPSSATAPPAPPAEPATRAAQRAAGRGRALAEAERAADAEREARDQAERYQDERARMRAAVAEADPPADPFSPVVTEPQVLWAMPAPRKSRRGLIWAIVIGVLVLLLGGGVTAYIVLSAPQRAADENGVRAAASVQAYLDAVAAGDAGGALSHVEPAPAPGGLLTDAALAASKALAPISGITATAQPIWGTEGQIAVQYLMGDTPVSAVYTVADADADGTWSLETVPRLRLGQRFAGLPVSVGGVPVVDGAIDVLPGTYPLTMGGELYTVSPGAAVTVVDPEAVGVSDAVVPSLTEPALKGYRDAVVAAVNACLASRALASGCGLDLPATLADGTALYEGTVFRTLTPDARAGLAAVVPELDPTNPALARSGLIGAVGTAANCTQNGANGECDIVDAPALQGATIDMTRSPLTVLWQ